MVTCSVERDWWFVQSDPDPSGSLQTWTSSSESSWPLSRPEPTGLHVWAEGRTATGQRDGQFNLQIQTASHGLKTEERWDRMWVMELEELEVSPWLVQVQRSWLSDFPSDALSSSSPDGYLCFCSKRTGGRQNGAVITHGLTIDFGTSAEGWGQMLADVLVCPLLCW